MVQIFFSSNLDVEFFKCKEKLCDLNIPENYNLSFILINKKDSNIIINIVGKSELYNKKLKIIIGEHINNIDYIKSRIENAILDEIKLVNNDIEFINSFINILYKYKNQKSKLFDNYKNELNRFEKIMNKTYKDSYKITDGLYEDIYWKPYFAKSIEKRKGD